jgi:3',5'-cyclic AMP phosphodiesterase CpdA
VSNPRFHPVSGGRAGLAGVLLATGCGTPGPAPSYDGDLESRGHLRSVAVVGDTQRTSALEVWHRQHDAARAAVLEQIARDEPAFVLHLGDLVFQADDPRHWEGFDRFAAPLRDRSIPVWPIPGNHEYWGRDRAAFEYYFARFPHLQRRKWNSLRFGPLGFVLLDSNEGSLTPMEQRDQAAWYLRTLEGFQDDPGIRTVVVACHHPPYTNSTFVSPSRFVRETFVPPFLRTPKAALFLSGHCHSYERFVIEGGHFVVSGGGGGPPHGVRTGTKARFPDAYAGGKERPFHYCRLVLRPDDVEVRMMRLDGTDPPAWSVGETFVIRTSTEETTGR